MLGSWSEPHRLSLSPDGIPTGERAWGEGDVLFLFRLPLRAPPVTGHRELPALVKVNAFAHQQETLESRRLGQVLRRDAALRVDDTVPRKSLRTLLHCPAHRARRERVAYESGNLPVVHDPPARDLRDDRVDFFESQVTLSGARPGQPGGSPLKHPGGKALRTQQSAATAPTTRRR